MRKLANFAIPFALAVLVRVYLLKDGLDLPLGFIAAALLAVSLLFRKKRFGPRLCIIAAGLAAAFFWCAAYDGMISEPARALVGEDVPVVIEVSNFPQKSDYGVRVEGKLIQDGGRNFRVLTYMSDAYAALEPGDRVEVNADLADAGIIRGEESDYYYAKGIHLRASLHGEVTVTKPETISIKYLPQYLAEALKRGIASALPEESAALTQAVVTGDRSDLDDAFYSDLQRCGLAHTVAVSGMHLSFLVGLLNLLLRRGRRAAVVSIFVVVLFTLMAGATPSVVRAAVMQILLLLAPLLGREYDAPTALSAALLLLLLQNPYAVASISLHLSFGAVTGILLVSGRMRDWLCNKLHAEPDGERSFQNALRRMLRLLIGGISVSLGAMLFTLPLTALHFRSMSLLSPLTNVVALWAVEPIFAFGLIGGAVALLLPAVGSVVALPALLGSRFLAFIAPGLAKVPFVSIPVLSFYLAAWLIFAYALLALNLLWKGKGKRRPVLSAVLCIGALAGVIWFNAFTYSNGDMAVSVLNVGQGQSVLIRAGDCYAMVDCGSSSKSDPGDIAADFLESIGHRRLDFLILTHYHDDHACGIPQLLRRVEVDVLLVPDVEEEDELREEILSEAEAAGVQVRFVQSNTVLQVKEDISITVYPPLGEGTTNELGLSILATAGDFDALITGDMNTSVEKLLLRHTELPDIELLVVGHHGSRYATSRELLKATQPEVAVISVGRNSYGHPTDDVLKRLDDVGAEVYRTDRSGTVTISADDAA